MGEKFNFLFPESVTSVVRIHSFVIKNLKGLQPVLLLRLNRNLQITVACLRKAVNSTAVS